MGKIITFVMLLFITNVSLSVGSAQANTKFKLDIDGDGQVEPLTDGLLVLRYLFGFTGDTLIEGATQTTCSRCTAPEIQSYLASGVDSLLLDIDADGTVEPLTDGLLILRYLFGFSEETLISQAVQQEGSRTEAGEIEAYLITLVEGVNTNENSPVFNSVSNQTVVAGEVLNVTISATDADGDSLSFSSTTLPTYATLQDNGDNTATLRLAPEVNNVGNDTIAIEVTDGVNAPVSQSIGVTVTNVINEITLDISVNSSSDDAEEFSNGSIKLGSGDIELVNAQEAGNQTVGIRFTNIQLPANATISKAYLQFKVDEVSSNGADLILYGEAGTNPVTFTPDNNNISNRALTTANTRWIPDAWTTVGDQSIAQRSSDISDIIQELIAQPGWNNGQSMVFIIKGSGRRTAESFDGDSAGAPSLHIEYTDDGNPPPVAQFTATPVSGDVPLEVAFNGSGSSDNTPLTRYTWNFGDGTTTSTNTSNTTHTYTAAGSYTVSLTVTDEGGKNNTSTQIDVITATTPSDVVINEILAKNDVGLTDGNGLRHDWIELHNQGGSTADISGWCLTDKETEPQQWCFPESTSLAAGAYLIVYASKLSPPDITSGEYHAQLKLKNSGEYLALLRANGTLVDSFNPSFPQQIADVSYGRDSSGVLRYFSTPTPNAVNGVGLSDLLIFDNDTLDVSGTMTTQVNLSTASNSAIVYEITTDATWLTANAASGQDGETADLIDINVDTTGLADGLYVGTVTATANNHLDATVSVSLMVGTPSTGNVVINEFLAGNKNGLTDEDGDNEDWIELHNAGSSSVSMEGWCLTDDSADLSKWCFPAMTLNPDQYLLVFASGKDRVVAGSELHTNFGLKKGGEYLALLRPDKSKTSEYNPTYPSQEDDIAYGLSLSGNKVYFTLPTPGSVNNEGVPGTRDNIHVSVERGFYSAPIQVSVNVDVPHDTIMYTTDGSEPTLTHGTSYTTPINITTTTPLRVAAFKGGLAFHHGVISHSYIYLDDVIHQPASIPGYPLKSYDVGGANIVHDHEMDPVIVDSATYAPQIMTAMTSIPTLSIQVDPSDIYGDTGFYDSGVSNGFADTEKIEKKVSVEVLYFNQASDNHQANAGIEGHSKKRMKRSLRLNFRSIYGDANFKSDLLSKGPLHGDSAAGSYDKLIIRAGNNRTWARHHGGYASRKVTQTVDEFFRATQIDASGYGSRGTFVHLYINGIYWGLYNPVERPDSKFSASYFGGDSDDWFAGNHKLIDEREQVQRHLSGDITRYNYLVNTLIYKDMAVDSNYAEFKEYLNPSYFIDYLLLSWWGNVQNWPYNNLFFGNRNVSSPLGPTPLYFTRWDSEFSFDQTYDFANSSGRAKVHKDFRSNRNVASDVSVVPKIWHAARRNSEFMQLFVDRVNVLTSAGGALNDTIARARWATLNDFVREAVVAESARWGDILMSLGDPRRTRDDDWQREVDNIDGLLQGNAGQLINELRNEGYYP